MRQLGPLAETVVQHHGERPGQPCGDTGVKVPVISLPHPRLLVTALLLCPLSDLHPGMCVCVCVCVCLMLTKPSSQSLKRSTRTSASFIPQAFAQHPVHVRQHPDMRPWLTCQWKWAPEDPLLSYQLLCIFPKVSGAPWVPSLEKQL